MLDEITIRQIMTGVCEQRARTYANRFRCENDVKRLALSIRSNPFLSSIDMDFAMASTLSRSFTSFLGKTLEIIGQEFANNAYVPEQPTNTITSFLTEQQLRLIDQLCDEYYASGQHHRVPRRDDYELYEIQSDHSACIRQSHQIDNMWYDATTNTHYVVEVKAGGDLDNKKARSEKQELLKEYFLRKNISLPNDKVRICLGIAYNKYGDRMPWTQNSVLSMFSSDELLIGSEYWNLVTGNPSGYDAFMRCWDASCAPILRSTLDQAMAAMKNAVSGNASV